MTDRYQTFTRTSIGRVAVKNLACRSGPRCPRWTEGAA
jgi:3-oxoacyl-[acyl-carrier protein] reductase